MYPVVVIKQPGITPIHLSVREPIELGRECSGVQLADDSVDLRAIMG